MIDLKLEERITGRTPTEQASVSCALILDSPNGEFRHIFAFLNRTAPDASARLKGRIDPETGLMTASYFARRVSYECQSLKWANDKRGKAMSGTYAVFAPWEIEDTKTYLKTNKLAPTKVIGIMNGGIVGAFLPCGLETAQKALVGCPASGVLVPYELGADFYQMHEDAVRQLLPSLERGRDALRISMAEALSKGANADVMIRRYLALRNAFAELAPRYS